MHIPRTLFLLLVSCLLTDVAWAQAFTPMDFTAQGMFPIWFRNARGYGVPVRSYADVPANALAAAQSPGASMQNLTRDELVQQRLMLQQELFTLQREWTRAYGALQGAGAMAGRFANMQPPTRNYWNLQDLYNGTIIDERYLREPVIELSPASPRYGYIVNQMARARGMLMSISAQISYTKSQLGTIDRLLANQ